MNEIVNDEMHIENFSPKDIMDINSGLIAHKVSVASEYIQYIIKHGFVMREVRSAAASKVKMADLVTDETREVLMFGSNNYLGLANEPSIIKQVVEAVKEFGIGCGGPPLLNGTTSLHKKLEKKLAEFKKCDDAILFSSGYSANVGWVTGLLSKGDYLVYDNQNHASLHDGIKMGDFTGIGFAHNDLVQLEEKLQFVREQDPDANVITAVEGVYSMDGDISPLPAIKRLCLNYNSMLFIDDAHGVGVVGRTGKGTTEHYNMDGQVDIVMGTFSKTFGVTGGYIAGSQQMIDYLRLFARSHMFSASLPPSVIAAVLGGIEFIEKNPGRIKQLHENVAYFVEGLNTLGFETTNHTAIIPVFLAEEVDIMTVVKELYNEGIFVNGVEYPAVPKNRHRLRVSMMSTFSREELDFALSVFEKVGKKLNLI